MVKPQNGDQLAKQLQYSYAWGFLQKRSLFSTDVTKLHCYKINATCDQSLTET